MTSAASSRSCLNLASTLMSTTEAMQVCEKTYLAIGADAHASILPLFVYYYDILNNYFLT